MFAKYTNQTFITITVLFLFEDPSIPTQELLWTGSSVSRTSDFWLGGQDPPQVLDSLLKEIRKID